MFCKKIISRRLKLRPIRIFKNNEAYAKYGKGESDSDFVEIKKYIDSIYGKWDGQKYLSLDTKALIQEIDILAPNQ